MQGEVPHSQCINTMYHNRIYIHNVTMQSLCTIVSGLIIHHVTNRLQCNMHQVNTHKTYEHNKHIYTTSIYTVHQFVVSPCECAINPNNTITLAQILQCTMNIYKHSSTHTLIITISQNQV